MISCKPVLTALLAALASVMLPHPTLAAEHSASDAAMTGRVEAMISKLETYSTRAMEVFDVPGLAIGIVVGDQLIYAKGISARTLKATR